MNEEALAAMYEMAANDGYTGSLEAFSDLLKTNEEAVDHFYGMFQADGYTDSVDDFKTLMGAVEQQQEGEEIGPIEITTQEALQKFLREAPGLLSDEDARGISAGIEAQRRFEEEKKLSEDLKEQKQDLLDDAQGGKSSLNSLKNMMKDIGQMDNRARMYFAMMEDDNQEVGMEALKMERENRENPYLPTYGPEDLKGLLDDGLQLDDIEVFLGTAVNALTGFGTSFVSSAGGAAVGTVVGGGMGAVGGLPGIIGGAASGRVLGSKLGLATDMITREMISANKILARQKGITIEELVRRGEAEWFIPTTIGAIQGYIEKFQLLKLFGKTGAKTLSQYVSRFMNRSFTSGVQEVAQGVGSVINETIAAQGGQKNISTDTPGQLVDVFSNPETLKRLDNDFVNGVLGQATGKALYDGSRSLMDPQKVKDLFRNSFKNNPDDGSFDPNNPLNIFYLGKSDAEYEKQSDLVTKLLDIGDEKAKGNLSPEQLKALDVAQESVKEELEVIRQKVYRRMNKMSEDEINFLIPHQKETSDLKNALAVLENSDISEKLKPTQLETIQNRLNQLAIQKAKLLSAVDKRPDQSFSETFSIDGRQVTKEEFDEYTEQQKALGGGEFTLQFGEDKGTVVDAEGQTIGDFVFTPAEGPNDNAVNRALKQLGLTANQNDFLLNELDVELKTKGKSIKNLVDFGEQIIVQTKRQKPSSNIISINSGSLSLDPYTEDIYKSLVQKNFADKIVIPNSDGDYYYKVKPIEEIDNIIQEQNKKKTLTPEQKEINDTRKLLGKEPKFSVETDFDAEADINMDQVVEEMNNMAGETMLPSVPGQLTTNNKIDADNILSRFPNAKILSTNKKFAGIPGVFGVSDQLTTGSIKNLITGNRLFYQGGINFNNLPEFSKYAWAGANEQDALELKERAISVYQNNKQLFDRLWQQKKLPNGHIPYYIIKMGSEAIYSNEALYRTALDNISKIPERNKKAAYNALLNDPVVQSNDLYKDYVTKQKTLQNVLKNITELKLSQRPKLGKRIIYGTFKNTKPGPPNKTKQAAVKLLEGRPESERAFINSASLNNQITDSALEGIPGDHLIGVMGIDVLSPSVDKINHKNYPFAIKGQVLGILEKPIHAAEVFPEMYANILLKQKENKSGKLTTPKAAASQAVFPLGSVKNKTYIGAKMSSKMDNMKKLMGLLKITFPDVDLVDNAADFETALNQPDVKSYIKKGDVIYGFVQGKKIFVNPKYANSKVLLHEYGHVWLDFLKQNNPELLQVGYNLLEGSFDLEKYKLMYGDTDLAREELMVDLISSKGERIGDAATRSTFKNWLVGFWNYIKKLFKSFFNMTPDEIQNMTLDDFINGALSSMLSGERIRTQGLKNIKFSKKTPTNEIEELLDKGNTEVKIKKYIQDEYGFSIEETNSLYESVSGDYLKRKRKAEGLFFNEKGQDKFTDQLIKLQKFFEKKVHKKWLSQKGFNPKSFQTFTEYRRGAMEDQVKESIKNVKRLNKLIGKNEELRLQTDEVLRGRESDLINSTQNKNLFTLIKRLRQQVDMLTQSLIEEGVISDRLQVETLLKNMGSYLTRAYRLFDEDGFTPAAVVIEKARNFLRGLSSIQERAQEVAEQYGREYNEELENQVELEIDKILGKAIGGSIYPSVSRSGRKDLSILKKRGAIPKPIRELMGEYVDPGANYGRTIVRMTALLEQHKFLTRLRKAGMGVFFFEENDTQRRAAGATEKIEGGASMTPLAGLYADPLIAKEFNEGRFDITQWVRNGFRSVASTDKAGNEQTSSLAENYYKGVSFVKEAKTTLSPPTHGKNVIGNVFYMYLHGYTDPEAYFTALKANSQDLKQQLNIGGSETDATPEIIRKLTRLGVLNTEVQTSEIDKLADKMDKDEDFIPSLLDNRQKNFYNKTKGELSSDGTIRKAARTIYQAEDNYFKIVSFLIESKRYSKGLFKKPYEQLTVSEINQVDRTAAEVVKNILPNYNRIGVINDYMRVIPLYGTFISFQLEAHRTLYNTGAVAIKEMKDSNPEIKKIGSRRFFNFIKATASIGGLHFLLGSAAFAALGLSGDDEEEAEEKNDPHYDLLLPFWDKNGSIVPTKIENGKLYYINLSASNPFGQTEKALNGLLKGRTYEESLMEFATELLSPFVNEDILADAVKQVWTQENNYGRPLTKEDQYGQTFFGDSIQPGKIKKWYDMIAPLIKAAEPGFIRSTLKTWESNDKLNEVMGQFTGYKIREVDLKQAITSRANQLQKEIQGKGSLTGKLDDYYDGKISLEQYAAPIKNTRRARLKVYKTMARLYRAGIKYGLDPYTVYNAMNDGGVGMFYLDQIEYDGEVTRFTEPRGMPLIDD